MKKPIYIIGGYGTGKTTMANEYCKRFPEQKFYIFDDGEKYNGRGKDDGQHIYILEDFPPTNQL